MDPAWFALTGTIFGGFFLKYTENWLIVKTRMQWHNHLDMHCQMWYGDLHPAENDERNRWFGGQVRGLRDRRCLVCNPYVEGEIL